MKSVQNMDWRPPMIKRSGILFVALVYLTTKLCVIASCVSFGIFIVRQNKTYLTCFCILLIGGFLFNLIRQNTVRALQKEARAEVIGEAVEATRVDNLVIYKEGENHFFIQRQGLRYVRIDANQLAKDVLDKIGSKGK